MALSKNISETIEPLLRAGLSTNEICEQLQCSKPTVTFHRKRLGLHTPPKRITEEMKSQMQESYDSGKTMSEVAKLFNTTTTTLQKFLKTRNKSEAHKISAKTKSRVVSQETKDKLREIMLQRRANGYNWTLGRNRHRSEPSWPEKFWTKVIENEFSDKAVVPEYPMGRYSLDFAWPHLKKCIEIDGEQHYTDANQAASDVRKDVYLAEQGWQVMRIRWKDCFKDSKTWIAKANEFIDLMPTGSR